MATDPTGRDVGTDIVAIGIIATAIVAIAMGGGIHWQRSVQVRSLAAQ